MADFAMRQSTRADPQHSGIAWYSASQQVCCRLTLRGAVQSDLELVAAAQPPAPAIVAGLERRWEAEGALTCEGSVEGVVNSLRPPPGHAHTAPAAHAAHVCTSTHLNQGLFLLPTQPATLPFGPHTAHPNRLKPHSQHSCLAKTCTHLNQELCRLPCHSARHTRPRHAAVGGVCAGLQPAVVLPLACRGG